MLYCFLRRYSIARYFHFDDGGFSPAINVTRCHVCFWQTSTTYTIFMRRVFFLPFPLSGNIIGGCSLLFDTIFSTFISVYHRSDEIRTTTFRYIISSFSFCSKKRIHFSPILIKERRWNHVKFFNHTQVYEQHSSDYVYTFTVEFVFWLLYWVFIWKVFFRSIYYLAFSMQPHL